MIYVEIIFQFREEENLMGINNNRFRENHKNSACVLAEFPLSRLIPFQVQLLQNSRMNP